jgi:hypothetical protein
VLLLDIAALTGLDLISDWAVRVKAMMITGMLWSLAYCLILAPGWDFVVFMMDIDLQKFNNDTELQAYYVGGVFQGLESPAMGAVVNSTGDA